MATIVSVEEIEAVLPIDLDDEQLLRLGRLLELAEEEIVLAFARRGRDFEAELVTTPWLEAAARRAVREMVGAAVVVGENVGVRRVSSTTGPQSDSVEWHDPRAVSFGGVALTDDLLELLGLLGVRSRSSFPPSAKWPEVRYARTHRRDWRTQA